MKVFAFEFASGGGFTGQPLVPGLAREGDLMLRALVDDLALLPGIEILTSRDPRLPPLPGIRTIVPSPGEDGFALFARGVAACDAAWPTAPETGGTLARLADETVRQGRTLLGCLPDAVRIAASKRATFHALRDAGVPVVPTFALADELPPLHGPWVVKPDDGAGCEDTHLVADWSVARERLQAFPDRLVAQPWIDGTALSLSLLCAEGRATLLACNLQHPRVADGEVSVEGITVNAVPDAGGRLAELAAGIAAALPGLRGYVGVDLIGAPGGPVVLEINPRLTTSYCGLRGALGINVAGMVLDLLRPAGSATHGTPGHGTPVTISLGAAGVR
ncbi:MAG TPA: ATP-grasp domain-containing protein [Gemmatimonadales bacterium]|nr:ATP-grasp domain-containing protein [Gemmatimonadales bacterium]